jgi:thymidylate synthase
MWTSLLQRIYNEGEFSMPRGKQTREILGCQSYWDMNQPVITIRERKLGYKFMPAEAAWILSGSNKVSEMKPFSKQIATFSDDGHYFFGAYGPKIVEQLPFIMRTLKADPFSRQAVINIWRESPMSSRDTPCTISGQFQVRNDVLHTFATMRSSDVWLGIPYDVFNFSMISALLVLLLRENFHYRGLGLGRLTITAGNQHLYECDWDAATRILEEPTSTFNVAPINLDEFTTPDQLTEHLWAVAHRSCKLGGDFYLKELYDDAV